MNPQDEALKPCPFCGGDAHWCPTYIDTDEPGTVTCANGCGATVICAGSKAVRIAAWNTRLSHSTPGDAEVRGLLEKAAPFVGWASTRDQIIAGVRADELRVEIETLLATPSGRAQGGSGWLIEHSEAVEWLTLRPGEASYQVCWTKESNEALRFCRRQDAEDYVSAHFGGDGPFLITEHQWVAAPPAQDQEDEA